MTKQFCDLCGAEAPCVTLRNLYGMYIYTPKHRIILLDVCEECIKKYKLVRKEEDK